MRQLPRVRRSIVGAIRRLPAPRDEAVLDLLRAARAVVTGRRPARRAPAPIATRSDDPPAIPPTSSEAFGPPIGPPPARVEPLDPDLVWPTPPPFKTGQVLRTLYRTGDSAPRYDVELLEALNEEYASKPLVPAPRSYSSEAMLEAARRRVRWAHGHVDLRGKRVLEIGCGNGVEVWTMAHALGADAHGIDVLQLGSWDAFAGDRVHFRCGDMAVDNPYPPNSFERVVSYTVWEHVLHPHALLRETYDVLEPGGLAWIRANLYAGPKASHRYREIHFPWPHLLFTDEVVREWDVAHGRPPKGNSWVNRLSMHHYRNYFADVGFRVRRLTIQETPIDEAFYARFEDVLGRFPRTDLRQDFFLAVLEKPRTGGDGG